MSSRQVKCPSCGKLLAVPPDCQGRFARCAVCNHRFRIEFEQPSQAESDIASWLTEEQTPQPGGLPVPPEELSAEEPAAKGAAPEKPPAGGEDGGIRLVKIDSRGALFEFSAARLLDESFRCAMPRRCIQCGSRNHLSARVIVYSGTLTDSVSLEAERSVGALVLTDEETRDLGNADLLRRLPQVPNVPVPGNLPMPYWLCDMCTGTAAISGEIHVNTETGVGWCRLLVRNLRRAEEFAAAAGGECRPACLELKKANQDIAEHPWDTLAEVVQHRIQQWFKPREGEQFLAYVPDRDYVRTEDGMAGLLVSDRRLIYHTKMRHLEVDKVHQLQLELAMGSAGGHLQIKAPSCEIKRFAVDREGITRLRRGLTIGKYQAMWK